MATAVSTSRPASATSRNLLPVPPRPPFPTHPSVPDRVSRLRRLNLSLSVREGAEDEVAVDLDRAILRAGAHYEGERLGYAPGVSDNVAGGGAGYIRRIHSNRFVRDTRRSSTISDSDGRVVNVTDSASVRRSHRNIVTPRRHQPPGRASVTGRRSKSRTRNTPHRLRLPSISVSRSEEPEPQGIFLTSLIYEESPMPSDRQPSSSSSSTRSESKKMTDPASDVITPRDTNTSRDVVVLPALADRTDLALSSAGLQRVYLEGVDHMRSHVTSVEEEADRIDREFHRVDKEVDRDYFSYLKQVNDLLLQANASLRRRNVDLKVIDSDTRMVTLLNDLRADPTPDMVAVDALTQFWTEVKTTSASLENLLVKFYNTVFQRLTNNYITGQSADLLVPVCQQYALDIEDFLKELDNQMSNSRLVLKSFDSSLHRDLLDTTSFTDRLVVVCDTKAFPVLGFVHDICEKIARLCKTARMWLARDERFMHEISAFIRETRAATRKREQVLQTEKQKRKRVEKNVRVAQNLLHRNKEKLRSIESDLQELEQKLNTSREEQKLRMSEIQQKENMVDFLKVTVLQTKRNYSLQFKRSKLLRQVKDLEDYLRAVEGELEVVQDQILAKSHEKILLTDKINTSEQSYGVLKSDLDKVSENLEELEVEVTSLSSQLLQLEIVHTMKTSPETLDNLIDRPSTVKLSKSLKERIKERKKKAAKKK